MKNGGATNFGRRMVINRKYNATRPSCMLKEACVALFLDSIGGV